MKIRTLWLAVFAIVAASAACSETAISPADQQDPAESLRPRGPAEAGPRILSYSFERHREGEGHVPARSIHLLVPIQHFELVGRLAFEDEAGGCVTLVVDDYHRLNVVWPEGSAEWNNEASTIDLLGLGPGGAHELTSVSDGETVEVYGYHLVGDDYDREFSPTEGRPTFRRYLNEPGNAVCEGRYGVIAELAPHVTEAPGPEDPWPTPSPPTLSD